MSKLIPTTLSRLPLLCALAAALVLPTITSAQTINAGTLRIGSDLTYPPYNYFDDSNRPAGFDVELMTLIGEVVGKKVEFADTRFENLILGVRGSQFDVIASTLYVRPDRAQQIDYVPYMKTGISIAVAANSNLNPAQPQELCGLRVGSIKGAAWLEKLEELNKSVCQANPIDSREFPTSPEATQALLSGGVQVQLEDSAVLQDAAAKLGGRLRITSTENLYPVIVGLGVRKGNSELVELLNGAIESLRQDGRYDALLTRFNVSAPTAEEFRAAIGQ